MVDYSNLLASKSHLQNFFYFFAVKSCYKNWLVIYANQWLFHIQSDVVKHLSGYIIIALRVC